MTRLVLLLVAAALVGCSSPGLRAVPEAPARTVAIDATATLHLPPDCAAISLTFSAEEPDLGLAHEAVERDRAAFVAAVEAFDAEVQSGTIAYHPHRRGDAAVERFRASQGVVVLTRHFADIPDIIRRGRGLSDVSVRYFVEDMVQHRSRLRQMATEAAHAKASELAEGFDAELGEVLHVAEGGASDFAYGGAGLGNVYARVEAPMDDDAPPAPGAIPLRVTLRVTYALDG